MLFTLVLIATATQGAPAKNTEALGACAEDYEWWREAKFGIFIHWNMSSLLELGGGSWYRANNNNYLGSNKTMKEGMPSSIADGSYIKYKGKKGIPQEIYDNLYKVFNPVSFNARAWVKTFKEAGAKYIVLTTKHHDGFCMFDTKHTDYNIMNTPFARDVAKELSDACAEAGIKVIWYYSVADWYDPISNAENPMPYQEYLINHIHELFGNYKNIQGIWWDGGHVPVDPYAVRKVINQYNPHAITNGRLKGMPKITFGTPEQKLGTFSMDRPWETCAIVQGEHWFWNGGKDIKSINTSLRLLIDSAGGDGNLLLDFGASPEGLICDPVKNTFLGMGKWLNKYGESIYGTRGGPYTPGHWGVSTRKGNVIYLHITQNWSGVLEIPPLPVEILHAKTLSGGEVSIKQTSTSLRIELDEKYHQSPDTIIALEIAESALNLKTIESPLQESMSKDAKVTASTSFTSGISGRPESIVISKHETGEIQGHFGEEPRAKTGKHTVPAEILKDRPWLKLHRGHIWRFWSAKKSDTQPWIEMTLNEPKTFQRITLLEKFSRIKGFKIQIPDETGWETLFEGGELGNQSFRLASPVKASRIRLLITQYESDDPKQGPAIHTFDLFKE